MRHPSDAHEITQAELEDITDALDSAVELLDMKIENVGGHYSPEDVNEMQRRYDRYERLLASMRRR